MDAVIGRHAERSSPALPGPHLADNLRVLGEVDPTLALRLTWPVRSDHVHVDPAGRVLLRVGGGAFELADGGRPPCPPDVDVALFGVGLGERLDALGPARSVLAWERDPYLLLLALGRADHTQALRSRRLRFLLGADLVPAADDMRGRALEIHPLLGRVYADERRLLEAPTTEPVAFLACGTLFVEDVADSLRDAGFRVYGVDLAGLAAEELAHAFERARPAVVVAINYTEGLAEFCAERGVPMICWEIDPSTSALPPCTRPVPEALVFTYRRAHVDEFRRAGFDRVEYLPLAANERRRAPQPVSAAERDAWSGDRPAFVGASLVTEIPRFELAFLGAHARLHGREDPLPEGRSLLDAVLAEQARAFGRYLVPRIIERLCPGLSTFLDGVAARAAGEIAAARKRQAYVAALGALPSGVDVWGDAGWAELRAPGVRYRGPARHTADLNRIYSACPVNVDIGRLYQNDIVTMRVFDVLACGGVLLAEWSPALEELFVVGRDVLAYHDAEDLVSHAARLLRTPTEGRALADAGRRAVLAHHTIALRVAHMLTRAPEIRR